VLTTPHLIKSHVTKRLQGKTRTWTDTLVVPKQRKWGRRFGTWNVRSLYRAGSLTAAARELAIVVVYEEKLGTFVTLLLTRMYLSLST
jgi:hypothetical protein